MRTQWAIIPMLATLGLGQAGCDRPDAKQDVSERGHKPDAAPQARDYCGGEGRPGTISAYFERLARHLATSPRSVPLDFYSETFSVTTDGDTLYFRRAEMGAGARALPTLDDWRDISERGVADLKDGGWRGCFLGDGKASFEINGAGEMGLLGFDKGRDWGPE